MSGSFLSFLIPPFCFDSNCIHLAVSKHPDTEKGIHKNSRSKYSWNWKDFHKLIWNKPNLYITPMYTVLM